MMTIDFELLDSVTGGAKKGGPKKGVGGLVLDGSGCPVHSAANVSLAQTYLKRTHQRYEDLTAGYAHDPINQYNYVQGNRCDPDSD